MITTMSANQTTTVTTTSTATTTKTPDTSVLYVWELERMAAAVELSYVFGILCSMVYALVLDA